MRFVYNKNITQQILSNVNQFLSEITDKWNKMPLTQRKL